MISKRIIITNDTSSSGFQFKRIDGKRKDGEKCTMHDMHDGRERGGGNQQQITIILMCACMDIFGSLVGSLVLSSPSRY